MASAFIKVVAAILAIIAGIGLAYFWSTLRPEDDFWTVVGVGAVGAVASFSCLFFLTKGSGGD